MTIPNMTKAAPTANDTSMDSDRIRWASESETTGRKKRKTPALVGETSSRAVYQKRYAMPEQSRLRISRRNQIQADVGKAGSSETSRIGNKNSVPKIIENIVTLSAPYFDRIPLLNTE